MLSDALSMTRNDTTLFKKNIDVLGLHPRNWSVGESDQWPEIKKGTLAAQDEFSFKVSSFADFL
jgi:hypothetical protein